MSLDNDELFSIFNDINFTMITNNLVMKDKIFKKIEIIKQLSHTHKINNSNCNILNYDILNYDKNDKEKLFNILKTLNYKVMNCKLSHKQNKLTSKLNNILGDILHNAYVSTGYQVLISNIPDIAILLNNNTIIKVNKDVVNDTIIHYMGEDLDIDIIQIQLDNNYTKYLVKFKKIENAKRLCRLLDSMKIEKNIIRVEMLENTKSFLDNYYLDEKIEKICKSIKINKDTPDTPPTPSTPETLNIPSTPDTSSSRSQSLINIYIIPIYEQVKNKIQYVLSFFTG